VKSVVISAMSAVLVSASALGFAPPAAAVMNYGNYDVHIPDRRDFHTWVWSALTPCAGVPPEGSTCLRVLTVPQPVAKALYTTADARLADGRYTMTIDDPFGLRCGNIYYGPTVPTHDVYTWDATTLTGTMVSSFAAGCDGAPGGAITYPFHLTRM
jgi:hypothetical protein